MARHQDNLRRRFAIVVLLVASSACTARPEAPEGSLEALPDGTFRYVATASVLHPLNTDQGEHSRLVRLERLLEARAICPEGYEILSRAPPRAYGGVAIRTTEDWVGSVTYIGRCRT
jgi:hypothetical protein